MKIKILLLFLSIINFSFSQSTKYENFKDTKWSMIPPVNFILAANFNGFINNENGTYIRFKEDNQSYIEKDAMMTSANLKRNGVNLISKEIINFNNSKAILMYVNQEKDGVNYFKQILMFEDNKKTITIDAVYTDKYKSIYQEIRTTLLSISFINN